ncbi:hypothetical protein T03_935 [Trichinella britovi]|uniref:Uncharacterized protein n=4 Tax=Trichinella TaxID=6333 RepID=A0A0V1CX31_TRIBR|nr:hypothetical protein T05_10396 [Trichinella murrelli]KRY53840.1 hypothetical protein T03_935 [Trichinella britovi]KRZ90870.1 hypothetical protein T08_6768 [Trichinella sp. T8]
MSLTFFKNFLGIHCTDFEMLQVPNPKIELIIHVTMKAIEAGVLIGSLLFPLDDAFKNDGGNWAEIQRSFVRGGIAGGAAGLLFGPILGFIRASRLSDAEVFDRSYRLRFNTFQLNLDRAFLLASAFGSQINGPTGAVVGADLALLTGLLTYLSKPRKNLLSVMARRAVNGLCWRQRMNFTSAVSVLSMPKTTSLTNAHATLHIHATPVLLISVNIRQPPHSCHTLG